MTYEDPFWKRAEEDAAAYDAKFSEPFEPFDPEPKPKRLPMRTLDLAALAATRAKPKAFAIERIAPAGEVTLFTGPGSSGKSLLAQQLCTASAAGLRCLGLDVVEGAALYVTCEDDPGQLHWRQEHLCQSLGVDMASLAGKLHLVSLRGALDNALDAKNEPDSFMPSAAWQRLSGMITATGAKIVALDNVAHLFSGKENDRHDVTQFVNLLNRLAGETGAAILLIGHPNKSGDTYSGSTAWLNAVRSQVWIDRDRDGEGEVRDPDVRVLTVGKANYCQDGELVRFRWHNWAFVRDEDLPDDTRAEIDKVIKANAENAAFLACLRARTEQGDGRAVGPAPGPNYAPSQFEGMPQAKGCKKAALKRAMDRLFEIGTIESVEVSRPGKSGTKTILREVPERSPERLPNTIPEPSRTPARTPPHTLSIPKGITGAGPDGPPPPDDGGWIGESPSQSAARRERQE